jgi:hypothetical protein
MRSPYALVKLIPGGVDIDKPLRNAVMLVYGDVVSRQRALSRISRLHAAPTKILPMITAQS